MNKVGNNYAFIDGNNLHRGISSLGWKLDYKKFRIFLADKFSVTKAYYFIGYVDKFSLLYKSLQEYGYTLIFKPTFPDDEGEVKGNCDAELVLQAMIDLKEYEQAVLVSGDGDFYCLVNYWESQGKLAQIISPEHKKASRLLKKAAPTKMLFLEHQKQRLQYERT